MCLKQANFKMHILDLEASVLAGPELCHWVWVTDINPEMTSGVHHIFVQLYR